MYIPNTPQAAETALRFNVVKWNESVAVTVAHRLQLSPFTPPPTPVVEKSTGAKLKRLIDAEKLSFCLDVGDDSFPGGTRTSSDSGSEKRRQMTSLQFGERRDAKRKKLQLRYAHSNTLRNEQKL